MSTYYILTSKRPYGVVTIGDADVVMLDLSAVVHWSPPTEAEHPSLHDPDVVKIEPLAL